MIATSGSPINEDKLVAILDYGMGNLHSAEKGLQKVGVNAVITSDPGVVRAASGVVLPGVGAFRDCRANLLDSGLVQPMLEAVDEGRPFLGICLGMQLLMTVSEEFGRHEGLGLIPGKVVRFPEFEKLWVPHMGWNRVFSDGTNPLLAGIPDGSFFYFVHSYYVVPQDEASVGGWTDYGIRFCSAIASGKIFATQFHPEKSAPWGLNILDNFGRMVAAEDK
jgi:glutamine amidotransferase